MESNSTLPASTSSGPSASGSSSQTPRRRHRNRPKKSSSNKAAQAPSESTPEASGSSSSSSNRRNDKNERVNNNGRPNQRVRAADPSKVVRKPTTANPHRLSKRDQEIAQLRRGFPSLTQDETDSTKFRMQLIPSDPDFPFDIQSLDFNLYIPLDYPSRRIPHREDSNRPPPPTVFPMIVVQNEDIPKGFSVNVDMGFKLLSEAYAQKGLTLLDMIVALDRELENFLRQGKRDTIKIVKMNNNRPKTASSDPAVSQLMPTQGDSDTTPKFNFDSHTPIFVPPEVRKERQAQIDKLKHSLGESSMWTVSSDKSEDVYGITVTPKNPTDLPSDMNGELTFNLHVPNSYGISEPCFVIFPVFADDFPSSRVEGRFNEFARIHKDWKLFSLVNFLACRVGDLMSEDYEAQDDGTFSAPKKETEVQEAQEEATSSEIQDKARKILSSLLQKPTTTMPSIDTPSIDTSATEEANEEAEMTDDSAIEEDNIFNLEPIKPRGIALQVPTLSMTNVGILECTTINLVVICDRCGTQNDLFNVVSGPYGRDSKPVAAGCTKCKAVLACAFQKNLLHQNMTTIPTAGYLDMSGCSPADVLGSTFVPTCENCTTSNHDAPFKRVESQRATTINCRSCHIRMTLQLGDDGFNFEAVSDEKLSAERLKGVRSKNPDAAKQKLGLTSGQPLPDDGKCTHFRKSTRWFRFSCCGKVYPCDKCHDLESNHPFEHGTRIICGKCSREQNFANTCTYCRHKFDNRGNTGFWEGGKGTRDPTKLNRNDRRKYKRIGKKDQAT